MKNLVLLLSLAVGASCGSTPLGAGPFGLDGGPAGDGGGAAALDGGSLDGGMVDGGPSPTDGGTVELDGGSAIDGGATVDGGTPTDGGAQIDGGTATDGGSVADGGTTSGPCAPGAPMPPANQTRTLSLQNRTRSFKVHVPPGYAGTATPLVFNFHGFGSTGAQQELFSKMTEKADAAGFIVVYPEGTGIPRGWNGGICCGSTTTVDDVAFVAAMIEDISASLCVDPRRIFATGMSNGGILSHRLACELSDRIAAAAPVAGVIGVDPCSPSRPFPVMHFHGTADAVVPFSGGGGVGFPSVADTMAGWVQRNGCAETSQETFANGDSRCETWPGCSAGSAVVLCTVDGGGHTWPGGTPFPTLGHTTTDLSANDAMWDFFVAHPLP